MLNTSFKTDPKGNKKEKKGTKKITTLKSDNEFNVPYRVEITIPFLQKDFTGFKEAVAFKESGGRYYIVNTLGYLGKYQFGKSTLRYLRIYNRWAFLKNPELQEKAFIAYCKSNKFLLRKYLSIFVGKKIRGVIITESGLLAAAHLGGAGNVKKFLRTYGRYNFKDAYGTSIKDYLKEFAGYDVSFIKAERRARV